MMINEQKNASTLMPKSKAAIQILQARAKQLAKQEVDVSKNHGISFVHFRLGQNESYGVSYQYVQEILHNVTMELPPFVPNFISGVFNWRGALITVVDLIKFFHPHHAEHHSKQDNEFIIVIHANNITLGLLANRVEGSEVYQPDQLATPLSAANVANPEYILGLHQAVTAILNVETIISSLNKEIKMRLYKSGESHGN
ncbi:chemotaxis signal transduction protein (cheW domain) [Legionella steigerwaltii]|uniref:Chemotaxis signal transduction protein (CheW domain) n=1 Tax=Legionella steigerwaltii TaxID=460 RepID=A0A378LF94_9GAMM|nr:chemotaxis protein CheW [Legionella steigerwaltii]KTD79606.1 chemotaxis signal transduction protein (cheW domain) [Legionella steigerwaltii]STY24508.1 chemotaxis signal transduction protein (cheW domain) [Legionella steigerwaltii]